MRILIINGPNLNLLGHREPNVYGNSSFEHYFQELQDQYPHQELTMAQSNHEGALIDHLHEADQSVDGVILNAGGYTHTSVALADAVAAISIPVIEVHISHPHAREAFRHHSYLSAVCNGTITGFGLQSYRLGIEALLGMGD